MSAPTPADLAATIYTSLGIDPAGQFETPDGQPIRLVDSRTVGDGLAFLTYEIVRGA